MDTITHEQYMKRMAAGPEEPDEVNSPAHYNTGSIEAIEAIEAALGPEGFEAYCRGNAIKYLWRGPHKHKDGSKTDYRKAIWYMNRITEGN